MKRIRFLSILMVFTILFSLSSVGIAVSAEEPDRDSNIHYDANTVYGDIPTDPIEQKFADYLGKPSYVWDGVSWYLYGGVLYRYYAPGNTTDEPDYCLIFGAYSGIEPAECYGLWEEYILLSDNIYLPNYLGLYLYSTKEDAFYPLGSNAVDPDVNREVIEHYLMPNQCAKLLGDADSDGALTILDATYIQRTEAKLCQIHPNDRLPELGYGAKLACVSDMNRDGERDILDATAIQRRLAHIVDD